MKNLLKVLKRKAEDIYYSDANIYLNGKLIKPSALPVFSDDTFYIPIDLLNEIQKYNTMSFELIKISDVTDKDSYFCIMADSEILASAKLADLEKSSNFSISLDNVDTLRFFSVAPDKNIKFIITNICTH